MKNLTLSAIFLVVILAGCRKYDNTLEAARLDVPAFTETGANTFGCLVNGGPWANFGSTVIHQELGTSYQDINKVHSAYFSIYGPADSVFNVFGTLSVSKKGKDIRQEYMSLSIPKSSDLKGTHQLTTRDYLFQYTDLVHIGKDYYSLIRSPFTVIIYKDSVIASQHIVSGKFYGTLYNNAQTDSVKITGGIFDVKTQY